MKRLIRLVAARPWPFVALLALVTGVFAAQLGGLRVNISAESMMERGTPAWNYYRQVEATFGSDNTAIVFLHDPGLFSAEKLSAVRDLVASLEALPFVTGTASLFSVRNVKNDDGYISARPYLEDPVPDDPQALAQIRDEALQNPLVRDNLLSRDGRSMAVNVFFKYEPANPRFDAEVTAGIDNALLPLKNRFEQVFQVGSPRIRDALSRHVVQDQKLLLPLSIAVLLMTLAVSLRQASAALIPLLTASLSVLWTLGFMAWLDIPVNIMTSIVPALVIVIGSTEDIHLLAEYQSGVRAGARRDAAIGWMADNMGLTVLLTFVTTYIGFLSIALNNVELVYQFGLVASTGLLFNFVITIVLVPVLLRVFGESRAPGESAADDSALFPRLAAAILGFVEKRKKATLAGAALVTAVFLAGATQLHVNNDPLDFLEASSPIHGQTEQVHTRLAGIHTFAVVVESGIQDTFLLLKYLKELEKIQGKIKEITDFDKSFSFADFISLVNSVMADEGGALRLPDADEIVREYMLFIKHRDVKEYVSDDFSQARILVRHNVGSSEALNRALEELRTFIDANVDPALRVEITGESILSDQAIDAMARGQFSSLLLIGAAIFLMVSVLFVNFRAGLVALLPNLLPVVILFGVMGFAGIPLDAGTGMVAAIALGICVDDTMHVMSRYSKQIRIRQSPREALHTTFRSESVAIFTTSVALAGGFGVLATSSFIPVAHFGLLSAMVILIALAATFFVTPILLGTAELLTVWEILAYQMNNDAVKRSPLFAGLNVWQIKKVLLSSEVRQYGAGAHIVRQGDAGREMFVVLDGEVEARNAHKDGSITRLRHIESGGIFGELAVLSKGTRTADVVALGESQVLVLSWDKIDQLSRRFPLITFRLFRNLTGILGQRLTSAGNVREPGKDDMTGVYSKAFFVEMMARELQRAQRYDHPVAFIAVKLEVRRGGEDLDVLQLSDAVLVAVVDRIVAAVRSSDVVARWDDRRFSVLLPHAARAEADEVAARTRSALEALALPSGERFSVTCEVVELGAAGDVAALLAAVD